MFNNHQIKLGSNSQTVSFNQPCTGILQRSHPSSIFIRFQKSSTMEKMVFPNNGDTPYMHDTKKHTTEYSVQKKYNNEKIEIIVLQILLFGDNEYLVEVVEPKFLTENDISENS